MRESVALKACLQALYHPDLKTIDLSLGRMQAALEAAGSPEKQLPPVIHLAGTNGKGSTLAMLRAIFEAAGLKVHAYTSPHLVHAQERFYCAGEYPSDAELITRLKRVIELTHTHPLTFFEATTLLAFQLFSEIPADVVLLETGMGGQFDATNVIAQPALTIITPISMDHQAFLGDTLAKIAYEKACIMKQSVPCAVAPQAEEAMQVLQDKANELNAPLYQVSAPEKLIATNMPGAHQQVNAAVAKQAVDLLRNRFSIADEAVAQGLSQVHWPGRLQPIALPGYEGSASVWLDGGHNEAAAEMLAAWMASRDTSFVLICAMTQGHDPKTFLKHLLPYCQALYAVPIDDEPMSHKAETVVTAARQFAGDSCHVQLCGSFREAITSLNASKRAENTTHLDSYEIICTGSLYFAGQILAMTA